MIECLERIETLATGLLTIRRHVRPDGAFLQFDRYREAEVHAWRRGYYEDADELEVRLVLEASLLAVRRNRVVALVPIGEPVEPEPCP
jgi:hypothetical protein